MTLSSATTFKSSIRTALVGLIIAAAAAAGNAQAAGDTELGGAVPASTKLETENFLVEIGAVGPYKVGETGNVKISLTTKGVFHINGQYPYRFKAAAPADGVSYPKPILERSDGQFAEKTAVFSLPFVATHAGTFNVGGVFHMSVCSPASCLVQKTPLDVSVIVQ